MHYSGANLFFAGGPMFGMLVFAGAFVVVGVGAAMIYNRLVALRQNRLDALSQVDVQLRRRYDLIPNLVEVASGYLQHERETLTAVVQARNAASKAASEAVEGRGGVVALQALAGAEDVLSGALSRLMAVVERYPELKASETMGRLSGELASTEDRVAAARGAFNEAVRGYNTYRQSFPAVLLAGSFGFEDAGYLHFEGAAFREAPRVSFDG